MKKIDVIMTESLSSIIGPVQTIKRIIKNSDFFQENGYEITVFTKDNLPTRTITSIKKKNNIIVRKILQVARWFAQHSYIYGKYRIEYYFKETHRLLDYYQSLDRTPDVIVFHSIFDCHEFLKNYNSKNPKTILFTHSDGLVFEMLLTYFPKAKNTKLQDSLYEREHYVMSQISMNACIAKIEQKNLLNFCPELGSKTCLVVNGIDDLPKEALEETKIIREANQSPKYRIACSGGINGRKGQWMIIEAMRKLPQNILDQMHVTLIGDGPQRLTLENRVKNYGLENHLTFTGALPNKLVYKELAKSNVFVLMSELEGLPIALLEALRSGMALVATNVSGIPELIDEGINGFLLPHDSDSLADFFLNIENYDWDKMGENSRKKFKEYYTFERMKQDYLKMLNNVAPNE